VHRDLKPDNLFITAAGEQLFVKILDFGIAKSQQPGIAVKTATFAVIGTPRYMSPEQLVDTKNATKATDVWALGAVAYEALTGALPFDAESVPALTLAVFSGDFTPASQRAPALPPGLDAWFARIFQQEPSDRFASTGEMARAFHEALHTPASAPVSAPASSGTIAMPMVAEPAPIAAIPASTTPQMLEPPKKSRAGLWLGLAGALVVTAGAIGGVALWLNESAESSSNPEVTSSAAPQDEAVGGVDTFENANEIVSDAIKLNDAHGKAWAMTFHANGKAQIDLQDAKDRAVIRRYVYVNGKLDGVAPLELSKTEKQAIGYEVFRKSAARLDMLPQLIARALKRARRLDGAKIERVTIQRTADQQPVRPIHAVVIRASGNDVTYEFWAKGSFRCERKSGESCPAKP
jgi:hypothetical protein